MKRAWVWPVLIAAPIVLAALSLMVGKAATPLSAWIDHDDPRWAIIFELRAPRAILAILVGGALGLAGAAMQGYTRNPLADPGVLGVSAMAALGAVLTLYFGLAAATPWLLPVAAITGAILGVLILMALSGLSGSAITFLLTGIVLQSVAGAAVALALSLAPNPWATQEIIDWLMGSLTDRSYDDVRLALPFIAAGAALLFSLRRALDALSLGEASAVSLGTNLRRTQAILAAGLGLAVGACVAVTGVLGFVGLIAPHLLRPLTSGEPGRLLAPSAFGGAALVLLADILVRATPSAAEIKLGVALSAIGGPFFLLVLLAMRRRVA
ncbi:MAG: iron ABC transporter permease [Hyphomonadaceae bacterium]|nr:iron ABC transporter permease [Hyphomonadaceae bacterium]